MASPVLGFESLLQSCAPAFTAPSFLIFFDLMSAWTLCPGRHTVTRMIEMLPSSRARAHDAYHRFLRAGTWSLSKLWMIIARSVVTALFPREGVLRMDLDDTLIHKSGRKIEGSGNFRDAIRSSGKYLVFARGLNLVVLTLRVTPPWKGEPLALPINMRLYRKGGPTRLVLAKEMVCEVSAWFPDHRFVLACDGAYAPLAGDDLPRTYIVSRMRRDAALYELPSQSGQRRRGRPKKKGRRLPIPEKLALRKGQWKYLDIDWRGHIEHRLVYALPVVWYKVKSHAPVLLVIVDALGTDQPYDFFFSTDIGAAPEDVAGDYAGRWTIEETFRNVKQGLGAEDPQCWRGKGPERAAGLAFWLYTAVWTSYIMTFGAKVTWRPIPWFPKKSAPSFADALAALRTPLWPSLFSITSAFQGTTQKFVKALIQALARAA